MISADVAEETRIKLPTTLNEQYLREVCAFALALHRGTGFRLLELIQGTTIRNVVIGRPDGNLHGIHGVLTEKQCCQSFFTKPPYEFRLTTEADLLKSVPIDENEIERATKIVRKLWPDLPWK